MRLVLLKWTQLHCTATTLSCDEARGGFVHGVPWTLRPVHTECPGPAISRLHPSWQELAQERAKSGCGSPGALSAACPTSAHHSPPLPPNCPNLKTLPGKCHHVINPRTKLKSYTKYIDWWLVCLFIRFFDCLLLDKSYFRKTACCCHFLHQRDNIGSVKVFLRAIITTLS